MLSSKNYFIYNPGGENEGSGTAAGSEENKTENIEAGEGEAQPESLIDKIKDALQDWSNKDEADQEFDDTRV